MAGSARSAGSAAAGVAWAADPSGFSAFEQATANLKLGAAAATGVVMLAFLFAGSVLYLRLLRQEEA